MLLGLASSLLQPVAGRAHVLLDASAFLTSPPETVLLVLGSEMTSSKLRGVDSRSLFQPLAAMLEHANSSVMLPYALKVTHSQARLQHRLMERLANDGVSVQSWGCVAGDNDGDDAALEQLLQRPGLTIACPAPASTAGPSEALAHEIAQVERYQQILSDKGDSYAVIYASQPDVGAGHAAQTRRRLLASSSTTYTTCGTACQTQVRWLEAMLAVLFMAAAAVSGLSCLYLLDTPTRFHTAREQRD